MLEPGQDASPGGALGSQIRVGTLDAELEPLVLSKAAQHGLAPSWITRLARLDPHRRQVNAFLPVGALFPMLEVF